MVNSKQGLLVIKRCPGTVKICSLKKKKKVLLLKQWGEIETGFSCTGQHTTSLPKPEVPDESNWLFKTSKLAGWWGGGEVGPSFLI